MKWRVVLRLHFRVSDVELFMNYFPFTFFPFHVNAGRFKEAVLTEGRFKASSPEAAVALNTASALIVLLEDSKHSVMVEDFTVQFYSKLKSCFQHTHSSLHLNREKMWGMDCIMSCAHQTASKASKRNGVVSCMSVVDINCVLFLSSLLLTHSSNN